MDTTVEAPARTAYTIRYATHPRPIPLIGTMVTVLHTADEIAEMHRYRWFEIYEGETLLVRRIFAHPEA